MNWADEHEWVDGAIKTCFVFGIFPLVGLPLYIIFSLVLSGYYLYMETYTLFLVFGTEENSAEAEEYNILNWFIYPFRRRFVFNFIAMIGTVGNILFPINFIIVPVLGLLAWANNIF